ncbi:hypothetical protein Lalb_Chr02g0143041 [Lupinus albus]|uniref:Uncharacterized protein n=1 Tax=Lupinus albus TaxID=3870 RepID=A0A6A4QZ26_LUPAL|nr:hypothetical protein Lalb_Chr02g0143041 [Lupinus albus]
MNIKDHADYSCYILFEASGDSEGDCDPMMGGNLYEHDRVDGDDDDDALSCSYDGSDEHECCDDDEYGDEKKENDEELVDGASYCEDDDEMEKENNSKQEFVDEIEKNRLFWEACLAS